MSNCHDIKMLIVLTNVQLMNQIVSSVTVTQGTNCDTKINKKFVNTFTHKTHKNYFFFQTVID